MPTPYTLRPANTIRTEIAARFGNKVDQLDLDELTSPSVSMLVAGAALAFCERNGLNDEDRSDVLRILLNDEDFARLKNDLRQATK